MFKYALVALLAVGLTSSHHLGSYRLGAPLKIDGTVDETPEVKYAKAAHLTAHALARGNIVPTVVHSASIVPVVQSAPIVQATPLVYSPVAAVTLGLSRNYVGPAAPLNADGTVAETPEVMHAKAIHFAAKEEAKARNYYAGSAAIAVEAPALRYTGPAAPLNADGTVAETPEVMHAKAVHYALYNEAAAKAAPAAPAAAVVYDYADHRYAGPAAPLNPDGTVAETPEVMHAKAIHFAAKEEAKARNYYAGSAAIAVEAPAVRYAGPAAPLNADGTVAETPEVMHAKAVHYALYNEAAAKAAPAAPSAAVAYDYIHHRYAGPAAPLNADGTVAETPEVMHAKAIHFAAKEEAKARNYFANAAATPVVQTYVQPIQTIHHVQPVVVAKSIVEPAPLNADGTVAETPEVQHAKAVHFALYNDAAAKSAAHVYSPSYYTTPVVYRHKRSIHYPAPLNADGTVAETPEVMHAKAAHLAAHAIESSRADRSWIEPALHSVPVVHSFVLPQPILKHVEPAPLNPDGTVAETPAVQQAKAIHFAAHAAETAKARFAAPAVYPIHAPAFKYYGEPAPLNADGTVAETIEVRQAKAAHFALYSEAAAKAAPPAPLVAAYAAPVVTAAPVVSTPLVYAPHYYAPAPLNADGTVAETPEVQHAKAIHFALYNEAKAKTALHHYY